eukprot:78891-Pelagomonas_calceolata.AAC.3
MVREALAGLRVKGNLGVSEYISKRKGRGDSDATAKGLGVSEVFGCIGDGKKLSPSASCSVKLKGDRLITVQGEGWMLLPLQKCLSVFGRFEAMRGLAGDKLHRYFKRWMHHPAAARPAAPIEARPRPTKAGSKGEAWLALSLANTIPGES